MSVEQYSLCSHDRTYNRKYRKKLEIDTLGRINRRKIVKTKMVTILTLAVIFLGACGTPAATKQAPSTPVPGHQDLTPTTGVQGNGAKIAISGFKFDPATITIPVGTTVTWTNQDSANHLVAADDGSWKSESLAKGATFSHTFDKAGTYTYICKIHTTMKGTIIVK
jgi:plastocyanin